MPRRAADPNINVRNNLTTSKVNKRPFNPKDVNTKEAPRQLCDRPGMIYSGILTGILLLVFLFLIFIFAHFETNRHLKEITQNIDKSRKGEISMVGFGGPL